MFTTQLVEKTVSEQVYQFSDRLIVIGTADRRSAFLAEEFLKGYHLTKVTKPLTRGAAVRMDISCDFPPPLPSGLQSFPVLHGTCLTDGTSYFLEVDDSRVDVGPTSGEHVSVWLGDTPHARKNVAVTNVMAYALQAALRRCELYDFHAAGLVEPRTGTCFLFTGPHNSGKSTLTLRLLLSGWGYLTDDMMVLRETPRGVLASGLRKLFSVSAPTLAGLHVPRLDDALGTPVNSDPSKRRLDPSIVFPDSRVEESEPQVLCFPTLSGESASRLEPISTREAMALLIKFNPWAGYDAVSARGHLRVLGKLVDQTIPMRFHAGRDVLDMPELAAELFLQQARALN